jgi:urease accessory protein
MTALAQTRLAQTRLLQLASQALPIGGYSHSQGLESAIENRWVRDEATVLQWIIDVMSYSMATYEIPCLESMGRAWAAHDPQALSRLNEEFLATRESAELRSATVQMGYSMVALLAVLPEVPNEFIGTLKSIREPTLPCVWSGAADHWSIDPLDSITAYLWSWAENQVLVAMKAVPIGQSAGQRVLLGVGERIARLVMEFAARRDAEPMPMPMPMPIPMPMPSNFAPGLAILCTQHETQYSRLFRS